MVVRRHSALGVFGVLPEIVDIAAAQRSHRDAIGRIQHFQHGIVILLIARIGLQRRQRAGILIFHPG